MEVNSYRTGDCYECRTKEYIRIKRGKYFSNPPSKFYDRPPYSPSIKGPFSYTPPPGNTPNDIGPPHHSPARRRPYKVSKRPDEGLGEEDIHNIIKYLSNKDLNKLIEIAMESKRYTGSNQQAESTLNEDVNNRNNEHENTKYFMGGLTNTEKYVPYSFQNNRNTNYFTNSHQVPEYKPNMEPKDSFWQEQVSFLDTYIQKELNEKTQEKINMYTDSETMNREQLPNTSDLHNHDFDASFTNNIPNVIKVASSYDIKNFANLPLMNNENSKLDTVNSYEVPHYTVSIEYQTELRNKFN
ncbi:unnamed protein product [Danaus chrysippus]|uniref:(African queen) hypothetical protein n=1 Tax=Danaus chrysippus TaxID=151541 RepID=A0A8J2QGD9_9NEOP|nr:unnamed protein product [Danaus chrysippus]